MNKQFGGIFMAITLIVGAIAFPLAEIGTHTAFAEVGVDVNAGVKVKVGSDNDTASANTETKAKMGSESETNSEQIKIEVSVSNDKSIIKIESNGDEKTFVLDSTSKADIIAKIQSETSLSESEITSIWKFNEETSAHAETSAKSKAELDAEVDAKISMLTNASEKAKTKSRLLLDSIKGNLQKTDKRAYTIMLKAQANGYLDTESHGKPSYIIALSGTAQSKTKADAAMEGSVYLDLINNNTNVAKYTVSGGKLVIDNQNYDVLFGKVRETSLNNESGSSMILIAEVMKPDGDITTMKILLESSASVNQQTDSSWTILNPQSHIAGTWKLDAKGNMSVA